MSEYFGILKRLFKCTSNSYNNLMCLRNSKLLLQEDFELIEFLIIKENGIINNKSPPMFWYFNCGFILSVISVFYFRNGLLKYYLPITVISTVSVICMKQCYHYAEDMINRKSFEFYLQNLKEFCINGHKTLRLLMETEILSTGQVSTENVGAALYIPLKHLENMEALPVWKTLPQLRKGLANSLIDIIEVLRCSCETAKLIVPDCLLIHGFEFFNENVLLEPNSFINLLSYDGCISLKDLQILNDTYLILQSTFLRWVGVCISFSLWTCPYKQEFSKAKIINLLKNTSSKIHVICTKLKMQLDINNIFIHYENNINKDSSVCGNTKLHLKNIRENLHEMFLSLVSILDNLRNLEDYVENNNIKTGTISPKKSNNLNVLKEQMCNQLKSVRDNLILVSKIQDVINLAFIKKSGPTRVVDSKYLENSNVIRDSNRHDDERDVNNLSGLSDQYISSLDDVYLAVSTFSACRNKISRDDWSKESKPQIPKSFMSELETTLKPIKENFKEREKVALKRSGLVDIVESENSNNSFKSCMVNCSVLNINKETREIIPDTINCKNLTIENNQEQPHSFHRSDISHSQNIKLNSVSEECPYKKNEFSDASVAKLIATKSQDWGMTEEEYFSDG